MSLAVKSKDAKMMMPVKCEKIYLGHAKLGRITIVDLVQVGQAAPDPPMQNTEMSKASGHILDAALPTNVPQPHIELTAAIAARNAGTSGKCEEIEGRKTLEDANAFTELGQEPAMQSLLNVEICRRLEIAKSRHQFVFYDA